ncbi:MAG TPA: CDGSH iron-sulfur domain-containing protein [Solirubrobacterales bacterium]
MAARITPCKDGPYIVRGDFEVLDADGNPLALRRGTIALCRCGRSRARPFCDGTHKLVGFRTEAGAAEDPAPRSIDALPAELVTPD